MKVIVSFMSLFILFVLSYLSMTLGCGLEVKSWGWVLGCYFGVIFITFVGKVIE